ncbi:MAG: ion transporter [Bdellovibrionota bacterium]|nr:ion transporter [Bdellovibrionota bacterium]
MSLVRKVIEKPQFEAFVLMVIFLNSITLGLETSTEIVATYGDTLHLLDRVFLAFFSLEIMLKILVYKHRFFKDPWNIFDFIIVGSSAFPSAGSITILRALRSLRALRMISIIPTLKKVVSSLFSAIPGLGAITGIVFLLFYVGAVIATRLFSADFPEWFGNIGKSLYSLFQIMTLESWSMGIVRPVMLKHPYAWAFFIPFILVTTFTLLNLMVAVMVNAMDSENDEKKEETLNLKDKEDILEELRSLKAEIKDLKLEKDYPKEKYSHDSGVNP